MKYFLLLLLAPIAAGAQKKGDEKIIVRVADTSGILNRISRVLYEQGYSLKAKDEPVGFLMTDDRSLPRITWQYRIKALVSGNTVSFTAMSRNPGKDAVYQPVTYHKLRTHIDREVWRQMEKVAGRVGSISGYGR